MNTKEITRIYLCEVSDIESKIILQRLYCAQSGETEKTEVVKWYNVVMMKY